MLLDRRRLLRLLLALHFLTRLRSRWVAKGRAELQNEKQHHNLLHLLLPLLLHIKMRIIWIWELLVAFNIRFGVVNLYIFSEVLICRLRCCSFFFGFFLEEFWVAFYVFSETALTEKFLCFFFFFFWFWFSVLWDFVSGNRRKSFHVVTVVFRYLLEALVSLCCLSGFWGRCEVLVEAGVLYLFVAYWSSVCFFFSFSVILQPRSKLYNESVCSYFLSLKFVEDAIRLWLRRVLRSV